MATVTLSLFRFGSLGARLWVLGQMATARPALARMAGAEFWKLCGSGTGEGFTPRPNWSVWAILVAWRDVAAARDGVANAPVFRRWRGRAVEDWTIYMTPASVRGRWSGQVPFAVDAAPPHPIPAPRGRRDEPGPALSLGRNAAADGHGHSPRLPSPAPEADGGYDAGAIADAGQVRLPPAGDGPLAVLTRATLRPRAALRFWNRVPDISGAIGSDPNVAFKIGIGEVPMLHQVTFSVWPDAATMARFARADGPHARAIRAVREGDWFREELYARFRILGAEGAWGGTDPLNRLSPPLPALDAA